MNEDAGGTEREAQLRAVAAAWDRAMVANDADDIGRFMGEEWVIIGPDGRIGNRRDFLDHVRSGRLTHHTMTSEDVRIRVYGDTAVLIARGVSAGTFEGHAFEEIERQSNVFVRRGDAWVCVLTHLSRLAAE